MSIESILEEAVSVLRSIEAEVRRARQEQQKHTAPETKPMENLTVAPVLDRTGQCVVGPLGGVFRVTAAPNGKGRHPCVLVGPVDETKQTMGISEEDIGKAFLRVPPRSVAPLGWEHTGECHEPIQSEYWAGLGIEELCAGTTDYNHLLYGRRRHILRRVQPAPLVGVAWLDAWVASHRPGDEFVYRGETFVLAMCGSRVDLTPCNRSHEYAWHRPGDAWARLDACFLSGVKGLSDESVQRVAEDVEKGEQH